MGGVGYSITIWGLAKKWGRGSLDVNKLTADHQDESSWTESGLEQKEFSRSGDHSEDEEQVQHIWGNL